MQTSVLAIGLALGLGLAPQQNPPLDVIIERVSNNVQELESALPDHVCKENLFKKSALRLAPGMPQTQTRESNVTSIRQSRGGETYFVASREILSVSGASNGMADLWTSLGDDLARVFAPRNLSSNNYSFARRQNLRGVPTFVIDFETKPGRSSQSRGGTLLSGGNPKLKMKGKAWIDSTSLQVVRLEFVETMPVQNLPNAPLFDMKTMADYGSVNIAGKNYWLLIRMVKDDRGSEWIGDYTNCRKFEVTSEIRAVRP